MLVRVASLAWIAVLLVWLPLQSARASRRLAGRAIPKSRLYVVTLSSHLWLAVITAALDRLSGGAGYARARVVPDTVPFLAWTLGALAVSAVLAVASIQLLHRMGRRESTVLSRILPRTRGQRLAFVAVSLSAGIVEEYVYRGFCLVTLAHVFGSMPLAVLVVTFGFGLAHAYQSWFGIARTGLIGFALTVPVLATGSLLPSMAAHAGVDVLSGYFYTPLRRRLGLIEDEQVVAAAAPSDASDAPAAAPR